MRVLIVFILAFLALAAAKKDRSKIFGKDMKVPFNDRRIPHKPSTRITHGNEAVPHSRPWHVALFVPGPYNETLFCAGALIDEQNVLTSASCICRAVGPIRIVLGAHNIQEQEATQVVVSSDDWDRHGKWDPTDLYNDIGLIRLPSPVTLNEYIQPISWDNSTCSDDYAGRDANVSGWGRYDDWESSTSPVLREITVPVVSNDECNRYFYGIYPTNICTLNDDQKGVCDGDSGGALVLDGNLTIGIVSFHSAFGCAYGIASGYTRVCRYRDWIEQNRKK